MSNCSTPSSGGGSSQTSLRISRFYIVWYSYFIKNARIWMINCNFDISNVTINYDLTSKAMITVLIILNKITINNVV